MPTPIVRADPPGSQRCPKCGYSDFTLKWLSALANVANPGVEAVEFTCKSCAFVWQVLPNTPNGG